MLDACTRRHGYCNEVAGSLYFSSRDHSSYEASSGGHSSLEDVDMEGFPTLELLMQKTEQITRKIQELLLSAQERNVAR